MIYIYIYTSLLIVPSMHNILEVIVSRSLWLSDLAGWNVRNSSLVNISSLCNVSIALHQSDVVKPGVVVSRVLFDLLIA